MSEEYEIEETIDGKALIIYYKGEQILTVEPHLYDALEKFFSIGFTACLEDMRGFAKEGKLNVDYLDVLINQFKNKDVSQKEEI